jgi:N-acetylglucosamine kinase-like BadF-type ATPase
MRASPAVLAVDVGNSKTDLALVAADGTVLGAVRGPSGSHQAVGFDRAIATLRELAATAAGQAGLAADGILAPIGAFCMAGVDTPRDKQRLRRGLARAGFAGELILRNDSFAILRAGARAGWGVAVVAGAGTNGAGVGPTGRIARFGGLGDISGDYEGVGWHALRAAVRGRDGRGPRTSLERLVPAHFGLRRPAELTVALYRHRIHEDRLRELPPLVYAAAADGDAVALGIVEALGDEIAAFATAAIRRTGAVRREVDVVLAGGLVRSRDPRLMARVEAGVRAVAKHARIVVLDRPPVLGSALLGLDRLAPGGVTDPEVLDRLRAGLTDERLEQGAGRA